MRFFLLFVLLASFITLCQAKEGDTHCHDHDDADGRECDFTTKDNFLSATRTYCETFVPTITTPLNGERYYMKFKAPGGRVNWIASDVVFLGNIQIDNAVNNWSGKNFGYNFISYDRCMEYMPHIYDKCGGVGGKYETAWGSVSAICIKP
ncbi:hypothetical protein BDV96DRAFT_607827 [Lophiotrema nucula]|uniref:Uncharacterized protein n=1 Tax=Lophiotrema nucula TaxID=690887 RepID=A0A6A5YHS9_9PLEO|nr:hypothetical protein BDV96DRAFT_607827 [Lophiotrema nucula]